MERLENDAFWKRFFLVWTEKTMLYENGDVIEFRSVEFFRPAKSWMVNSDFKRVSRTYAKHVLVSIYLRSCITRTNAILLLAKFHALITSTLLLLMKEKLKYVKQL